MTPKKFRCWSKSLNGWVNIAQSFRNGGIGWLDNTDGVDDTMDMNLGQDEFIWLQYTGINDKNGIELYERDLVKYFFNGEFKDNAEIVYKNGQFVLMHHHEGMDTTIEAASKHYTTTGLSLGYASDGEMAGKGAHLELIGSRYDHPELVGGDIYE